jgi:putative endonuclease
MHYLYIIYSTSIDKFYVGESADLAARLIQHNQGFYKSAYTSQACDWILKLKIEFKDITTARKAEHFIKRMNSRKFIERLLEEHQWFKDKFEYL